MSEQERKATLEKIQKYIDRTKLDKDDRYYIVLGEVFALFDKARGDNNSLYDAIVLAFDYGKAKGYRKAVKEGKK